MKNVVVDMTDAKDKDMIETCPVCKGVGYLDGHIICRHCHGLGKVLTEMGQLYLQAELSPVQGEC